MSGVPIGTRSRTPLTTSVSRPALTSFLKCGETSAGLVTHTGVVSGYVNILIAGPAVLGQACLLQTLNALEAYHFLIYVSSASLLLAVAGIGNDSGGSLYCLLGHKQGM